MTVEKKHSLKEKLSLILSIFIVPAVLYVIFETVTGNLSNIGYKYAAFNILLLIALYIIILAVSGSTRIALYILGTVLYMLSVAEYFVVSFRDRPILIWDIVAFRTAFTVADNYEYEITKEIIIGFVILCILFTAGYFCKFTVKNIKQRIIIFLAGAIISTGIFTTFYGIIIDKYYLSINMWNIVEGYESSGYVLNTFVYFKFLIIEKPENYNVNELERITREYELIENKDNINKTEVKLKNIICIMNESFSDLSVIGDFKTNEEYLPFINGLDKNVIKGNVYTPEFGSMTCNPEFEFLTNNSMAFIPRGVLPYQMYINGKTHGLANYFNNFGYRTVAMHPYVSTNWSRDIVFRYMGFDEYLSGDDFEGAEFVRGYVSDKATYDTTIAIIEETDEPVFIFNVTMQNHGGYGGWTDTFNQQIELTEYDEFPMAEQYLSLIKESDDAFEYLLTYLETIDEPTMVLMFGDHQPSVEPEFFEELYGIASSELTSEEVMRKYITPFVIWTNYEMETEQIDKISVSYLSALMLEKAEMPLTKFQQFVYKMYKTIPVMHPKGFYDAMGEFHTWENWTEHELYSYFNDFHMLQYNNIFDLKNRKDNYFELDN
jgi:Phosphoglycerol transferase and related proteins, alkaline phosphatase superfamily